MALADLIRTGIAIADRQTKGTQVTLWHWPAIDVDEFGKAVYGWAERRQALFEDASSITRMPDGLQRVPETKLTILSSVAVTQHDVFAIAEEGVPPPVEPANSIGRVLDVNALKGPDGKPYMVEIRMGRATGS